MLRGLRGAEAREVLVDADHGVTVLPTVDLRLKARRQRAPHPFRNHDRGIWAEAGEGHVYCECSRLS